MLGAEVLQVAIPELGSSICIGIIVLVLAIIIIAYFLSVLIEFLPATLVAILVYIFTGSFMWTIVAFVAIALIMVLSRGSWKRQFEFINQRLGFKRNLMAFRIRSISISKKKYLFLFFFHNPSKKISLDLSTNIFFGRFSTFSYCFTALLNSLFEFSRLKVGVVEGSQTYSLSRRFTSSNERKDFILGIDRSCSEDDSTL